MHRATLLFLLCAYGISCSICPPGQTSFLGGPCYTPWADTAWPDNHPAGILLDAGLVEEDAGDEVGDAGDGDAADSDAGDDASDGDAGTP